MNELPGLIPGPPCGRKRLPRILILSIVFIGGIVVGAVVGAKWMGERMANLMRHPKWIPGKLLPKLQADLSLENEQVPKVEEILQRHYDSLEYLRAEVYPKQLELFKAMDAEVSLVLNPGQRQKWSAMLLHSEQKYLPEKPIAMPPPDRVFNRFDSNKDGYLSQSEVPPGVWRKIQLADQDGDGKVSIREYRDHFPKGFLD